MDVPEQLHGGPGQAVAIVGAALRFPGASDPASFHDLTVAGRHVFRSSAASPGSGVPPGGAQRDDQHPGRPALPAALLDERADRFGRDDDLVGGVTARHILAAETAADALYDIPPVGRAVAQERIGVFIADIPEPGGAGVRDWVHRQLSARTPGAPVPARTHRRDARPGEAPAPRPSDPGFQDMLRDALGALRSSDDSPANRGAVNGAAVVNGSVPGPMPGPVPCSLRAIAQACDALNSGEFDLVLAGGVATGLGNWIPGSAASGPGAASVRVYDASPTGSLPGEGCGIVALTRAADARAGEVPAYAEIAGWHYASPGGQQRNMLPQAYLRAGIDPADLQFVEGHGAATAAEDLDELRALAALLGPRPDNAANRCALGAVSANIGDTRAAAGVAALLKTAFAMTADVIPPSTGCVHPNRLLRRDTTPFRLPSSPEQWPQTPVQLAAVNTLGTAPHPDAPRSGPVHLVLRRERDQAHRPGRRRKPPSWQPLPRQPKPPASPAPTPETETT